MQHQTDYHLNHWINQPETGVKNTTEALEHAEQVFFDQTWHFYQNSQQLQTCIITIWNQHIF